MKENGVSAATLWRWVARYEAEGAPGLLDGPRKDKGKSRWFSTRQNAAWYVVGKHLEGSGISVGGIRRAMRRDRHILRLNAEDLPSRDTIRAFLEGLPQAPSILAREGGMAFAEGCLPYLKRKYTDVGANEIWVADHMICDVLVWDDCFQRDGKALRLRLTMVLDFRTRKALGYTFCTEASSWTIATAIRNALLRFGPCKVFYADNGKDFRKISKGATIRDAIKAEMNGMPGLLQRLRIHGQHCLPYHGQSKNVERSFRTAHQQFEAAFVAGYTTGKVQERPDSTRVAEEVHAQLLTAGRPEESPLCPASVYVKCFRAWLEDDYNNQEHQGEGMDGRSPNEVFDALYPPAVRPRVLLDDVAHLFYERDRRKVDSCAIRNDKRRYIGATAEAANALLLRNREYVWLAWDQNDPAVAVALDEDGKLIAPLRLEELAPQSEEARPLIAESMAQRRRMQKDIAAGIQRVADVNRLMGVRTERENLELAAGLAPAAGDEGTSTSLQIITHRAQSGAKAAAPERLQSEDIGEWLAAEIRRAHA